MITRLNVHEYGFLLSLIGAKAVTKNGFCEQKRSVESGGCKISAKDAEIITNRTLRCAIG